MIMSLANKEKEHMNLPQLSYLRIPETKEGMKFQYLSPDYTYHSDRYNKDVTVYRGMMSDGASGALDIYSWGWWIHDALCNRGTWDDGTKLSNWQASRVLADVLKEEGRWARSIYWLWATFLFGGGEARDNGMFKVK